MNVVTIDNSSFSNTVPAPAVIIPFLNLYVQCLARTGSIIIILLA
jgi:hypothetical protein